MEKAGLGTPCVRIRWSALRSKSPLPAVKMGTLVQSWCSVSPSLPGGMPPFHSWISSNHTLEPSSSSHRCPPYTCIKAGHCSNTLSEIPSGTYARSDLQKLSLLNCFCSLWSWWQISHAFQLVSWDIGQSF